MGLTPQPTDDETRAKILRVSPQLLAAFCMSINERWVTRGVEHGLPDDARVQRWFIDHEQGLINLVITSAKWPAIPSGQSLPWVDPCPVISVDYRDAEPD